MCVHFPALQVQVNWVQINCASALKLLLSPVDIFNIFIYISLSDAGMKYPTPVWHNPQFVVN